VKILVGQNSGKIGTIVEIDSYHLSENLYLVEISQFFRRVYSESEIEFVQNSKKEAEL
jgi:hypothetical protein